jgi:hypothetical protein
MLFNGLFERLKVGYLYENTLGEVVEIESKTKDYIGVDYVNLSNLKGTWDRDYCTSLEISGTMFKEIGLSKDYPEYLI